MVDFLQNIWSFSAVAAGNPCGCIDVSQTDLLAHLYLQPSPASCIGCTDVASNVMGVASQVKMASECTTIQHSLHPVRCLCTRMTKTISKDLESRNLSCHRRFSGINIAYFQLPWTLSLCVCVLGMEPSYWRAVHWPLPPFRPEKESCSH